MKIFKFAADARREGFMKTIGWSCLHRAMVVYNENTKEYAFVM